ncbi:hypothetical protein BFW01_g8153 [Lasiodiplodia theobromae]|nr:hypothetical protein BFW01_g8153 [Lasiodiplodia theobromae]
MSYLPELPEIQLDSLLIACLCLPTAPDGREKLDEALEGCLSPKTRNTPELKVVSVLDCNRQKKLEKERKEGSTSELFVAGCKAREKGWTKIGIVDNLTYRLLCGQKRPGENPECSMIILQTSPLPSQTNGDSNAETLSGSQQPEITAKRFPLAEAIRILTQRDEAITVNRSAALFDQPESVHRHVGVHSNLGLILHDWSLPLFHDATSVRAQRAHQSTIDQALAGAGSTPGRPALPLELADAIREELAQPQPLDELTAAPTFLLADPEVLEVHALVPLEDLEASTQALNEKLKAAAAAAPTPSPDSEEKDDDGQKKVRVAKKAVIYPWKREGVPASRHDFWRLWHRIVRWNENLRRPVSLFLDVDPAAPPAERRLGDDDDTDDILLIVAEYQYNNNPTLVSRVGLRADDLVRLWPAVHQPSYRYWSSRPDLRAEREKKGDAVPVYPLTDRVELLVAPDARFFHDPPPWKFADNGLNDEAHPCFFLTKGEGEEGGVQGLVDLMHKEVFEDAEVDEDNGPYAIVQWDREEDGGKDDMLRLAIECWEGRPGLDRGTDEGYCIFVDREAFKSKKVLYAMYSRPLEKDEDEATSKAIEDDESLDEETKRKMRFDMYSEGIKVVRANILEEELHLAWCNITTANLFFEEYFDLDQAETYRRQWKSEEEKRLAFERWDRTNWRRYL